jgi:hypothetical protein
MSECDLEFRRTVTELPVDLRLFAAELPFHLGLTHRPDGGWEEYTALAPFQSLPAYAVEGAVCLGAPLPPERLSSYLRAHCRGGFFGLLIDRLADGQVPERPEWPRLRQCLAERWEQSLADATGNHALAAHAVRASIQAWAEGLQLERALLSRRRMSVEQYVNIVSQKGAWLGASSFCLLAAHGQPARLRAFRLAFDLLLLSSQCLDDAVDQAEDALLHGVSFPTALGYPPGGLVRAAPRVARLGAEMARAGGFLRLGEWLTERTRELDAVGAGGDPLQNEMAALVLGEAVTCLCRQSSVQPEPPGV